MPADGRKDVSSKHGGLVFWEGASRSGAGDRVGCKMPLTALRFAFQENVDERRFGRLAHLLTVIQLEIERESADLGPFAERMTDCAAFSSEAMENGEVPEHMSARIDALARKLVLNRERQVSLEQQMSFVDRTRKGLLRILPSHGA
jgi:hypothetical protein